MFGQFLLNSVHHLQRHPIALPQLWRAVRAIQHEHGLTIGRNDVDMGGAVIIHIDSHAQAIEAKYSWHWYGYNLIAWVFQDAVVGVKHTFLFLPTSHPAIAERNASTDYAGAASSIVMVPMILSVSARIFRMRW